MLRANKPELTSVSLQESMCLELTNHDKRELTREHVLRADKPELTSMSSQESMCLELTN